MISRSFLAPFLLLLLPLSISSECNICEGEIGAFNENNTLVGNDGNDQTCGDFAALRELESITQSSDECSAAKRDGSPFCCGIGIPCFSDILVLALCASEAGEQCCDNPLVSDVEDGGSFQDLFFCDTFTDQTFSGYSSCCAPCADRINIVNRCLSECSGSSRANLFIPIAMGVAMAFGSIFGL